MLTITPIYAALIAYVYIWLSSNVITHRMRGKVSIGDGGDDALLRAIRAQGNCAEYAPIGLILLVIAELQGAGAIMLNVLGLSLLVGRVMHAVGFGRMKQILILRQAGTVLTFLMLMATAAINIYLAL